ncbi:hypothetical protein FACS189488_00580 [Betaproteobacteria bacterium]|nr:hypothetical protein FACS189488_00580 [Betaproteobacteria bacterium]
MNELDVVALVVDLPDGLKKGHVGTIVDVLEPDVYLVEFAGLDGVAYAILPVRREQLILLKYDVAA